MPTLAQVDQVNQSVQDGMNYLTQDPTGRWVGVGIGVLLIVIVLVIFFKMFKWAAARWKMLTFVAVLLAIVVYGITFMLNMGLMGLIIMGGIGFGAFFGFALFATQGGSKR